MGFGVYIGSGVWGFGFRGLGFRVCDYFDLWGFLRLLSWLSGSSSPLSNNKSTVSGKQYVVVRSIKEEVVVRSSME